MRVPERVSSLETIAKSEADPIQAWRVSPSPERERTAMTILDPITGKLITINTSARPRR
jgi:hypothetical protein